MKSKRLKFFLITIILVIAWKIYEFVYYNSEKFVSIKNRIEKYIIDCNELNDHIEQLKNTYLGIDQLDYGKSEYFDNSRFNYRRPEFRKQKIAPNIHNCSRTVCDNARKQPFKYICKYFNIKANEETLIKFETVLNNFEAAEQGKILLKKEKESILKSIENEIPVLIRSLGKKKLEKKLGFAKIDFSTTYFPRYIFKYISSGGNASCNAIL